LIDIICVIITSSFKSLARHHLCDIIETSSMTSLFLCSLNLRFFGLIYVYFLPLFWPCCIYASCFTRTVRLCVQDRS